jgi:type II secretory pathway pseudopilin PulG
VELIVVIVIIGILASIAVPALTGYIAKAEDKQWEMRARDISVAVRTVINEAYATDNLDKTYLSSASSNYTSMRVWPGQNLLANGTDARKEAALLLGETYPGDGVPGHFGYNFVGPLGSTFWDADGYFLGITTGTGTEYIYITSKIAYNDNPPATRSQFLNSFLQHEAQYDADAGIYVYHLSS